jgi:hypothetical protein
VRLAPDRHAVCAGRDAAPRNGSSCWDARMSAGCRRCCGRRVLTPQVVTWRVSCAAVVSCCWRVGVALMRVTPSCARGPPTPLRGRPDLRHAAIKHSACSGSNHV